MSSAISESRPRIVVRHSEIATALDARRRSLRVDTRARLITSGSTAIQEDAALMDVSKMGFRLATTEPVAVDSVFRCALMPDMAPRHQPRARVVNCREQSADGHDGGYVSRFEFEGPDAA